ncbi:MAG: hypothetical protein K6B46_06325 [Opitutales bacterium]|nr:hypothetical protein [Opitutales bacterium]
MESLKQASAFTFCAFLAAATLVCADDWGPIRGTLGQSSGEAEKTVPATEENLEPALPAISAEDDEKIKEAIEELPPLYEAQSDCFDVFCEDLPMMQRVSGIAELVSRRAQANAIKFSENNRRIEVWISPLNENDTPVRVLKKNLRKDWRCEICRDPQKLSDYEIAYILAEALVRQYAQNEKITFPQNNAPQWLIAAIADEALIAQSTGKLRLFRQKIENATPDNFEKIINADDDLQNFAVPDEDFRANAFLLGRAVRKKLKNFITDPAETLKTLSKITTTDDLQMIWISQFYATKAQIPTGTESPGQSRERYEEMLIFSVAVNGKETEVNAENILPLISQENAKLIIYRRLAEIANALPDTNPVWHNAFAELAAYYEMLSNPEPRAKLAAGTPWAPSKQKVLKNHEQKIAEQWAKAVEAREMAEKQSAEISKIMTQ